MKFRKLLCALIVFIMILGMVPFTALTAFAGNEVDSASESVTDGSQPVTVTNGNYSLTVNKTHFEVGEEILVSSNGSGQDWIGIYDDATHSSIKWQYVGKMGTNTEYDIRTGDTGSGYKNDTYTTAFPEGKYFIRFYPSGKNNVTDYTMQIEITVGNPGLVQGQFADNLSIEKLVFEKNEPIMISATSTGTDKDWIGVHSRFGTSYTYWSYIDTKNGGPGNGEEFDITSGKGLEPGEYVIRLIRNNSSIQNGAISAAFAFITVVDELPGEGETTDPDDPNQGGTGGGETTDPTDPDQGGTGGGETTDPTDPDQGETGEGGDTSESVTVSNDTHSMSVNKTNFAVGEPIMITATGAHAKDWIGIAKRDATDATIRWYYIASAGNGVAYDIKQAPNIGGNLSSYASIPEGLYTVYLIEKDGYLRDGFTFSINISVGDIEDTENGASTGGVSSIVSPESATYEITGNNGYAGGTVTVTMPSDSLTNHSIVMFWADANGVLDGYSAHARFKVTGKETTFTISNSVFIPSGATRLLVYSQNSSSGELSEECVSIDLPQNSAVGDFGKLNTSFFVISDIHIKSSLTDTHAQHFKLMLKEAITLNPDGMPIFIVGDIADNGAKEQYENMLSLYNEVLTQEGKSASSYPLFLAIGNHDYPAAAQTFLQYALLPSGEHPSDTSYDFWLNGYHYIFLGSDNPSGLYATLSEETLAWLDTKLSECRDPSRPTFVFLHQPMYNTVSGSLPGENWDGVTNEAELQEVLKKYPEVMMFNGHTHWEMNSKGNIFEGTAELPIHAFNCASVGYLWSGFNTITGESMEGSQGYYVELYDGKAVVRGRDFVNSEWISSAQYCIELEGGGTEASHTLADKSLVYANGYMSSGVLTQVCTVCGSEVESSTEAIFKFLGYSTRKEDSGICVGFDINRELLDAYEGLNGTEIIFGLNASIYDNLVNKGYPVASDGTAGAVTSGVNLVVPVPDTIVSVNLILKADDWSAYSDIKLNLCAFIIENGSVGYICSDAITEAVIPVTYSFISGAQA